MLIRPGGPDDLSFLHEMLAEAAYGPERPRPSIEAMLADPKIARYVSGWGREGDVAIIAFEHGGDRLGAAWYRVFPTDEPGYGFIDVETPELSIAVIPARRGAGIGSTLLEALIAEARNAGHAALSLSVDPGNRAATLYARYGFTRVTSHDEHWTMRLALSAGIRSAETRVI